jgi:tetratricopeptide (TPR) repeat protein
MSRKVKDKPGKSPPQALDTATLAVQAEADLAHARYKEATELYKELLKRERRSLWVDGLAACYAGRAHALADKGMLKEALTLWRNRQQLCGKPLAEGPYLVWLIQAGEQGEAVRLLADPALPEATRTELEMQLAGILLAWPDGTIPALPAESLLLRHRPAALAALRACQQGDFAALNEHLATIPFRSPYRDLKPLLKALALLATDRAAAAEAIARLPSNSPFERLAAVLRAAVLPDLRWLAALPALDADSRQLLLDLKGCPDVLRPLLIDLARLGEQPHPETWFDFLLRHRRELPAGLAESLCQRLLPHAESRLKSYTDAFGRLPQVRLEHLAALAAEVKHNRSLALTHWQRMAEQLAADPALDTTHKQRAALIWRRLSGIDISALDDSDADVIYRLKRSVEFDPDERETQLRLIAALRRQGELQQARASLELALPRFPKDAALLLEAVQVALASKAFKKAAGLAKQVLELDPINPTVRRLIGHAHFSHARKQIKTDNLASALKELEAAAEWLRAAEDVATLKLLRALASDDAEADIRLRDAVADLGGGLAGAFHLTLEAGRLGMNAVALLQRGGVDLKAAADAGAVVALVRAIEAARETEKAVRAALLPLRPVLKRAITGHYAEADLRVICEAWLCAKENELLRLYADAALKHWPQRPLFVYFKAASYSDKLYQMPMQLQHQLERAAEASHAQNDRHTSQRIQSLFGALDADMIGPEEDDDFIGELDAGDPGVAFEMLLQMGGEETLFKIARQAMGKATFDMLRKQLGGNNKDFARALIELMAQEARATGMPPPPRKPQPPAPRKPQPPAPRKPAQDIQRDLFDD